MEKHVAAYTLRKNGATFTEIAEILKVSKNTVTNWSKKHNWQSKLDDEQQFQDSSLELVRGLISHNLKILDAIKDKSMENIQIKDATVEELKGMLTERGDVDSLNKLFVNIRGKENSWDLTVRNTTDFIKYLEIENNKLARELSEYANDFLENKRSTL